VRLFGAALTDGGQTRRVLRRAFQCRCMAGITSIATRGRSRSFFSPQSRVSTVRGLLSGLLNDGCRRSNPRRSRNRYWLKSGARAKVEAAYPPSSSGRQNAMREMILAQADAYVEAFTIYGLPSDQQAEDVVYLCLTLAAVFAPPVLSTCAHL
jgi:hypothetical protein